MSKDNDTSCKLASPSSSKRRKIAAGTQPQRSALHRPTPKAALKKAKKVDSKLTKSFACATSSSPPPSKKISVKLSDEKLGTADQPDFKTEIVAELTKLLNIYKSMP